MTQGDKDLQAELAQEYVSLSTEGHWNLVMAFPTNCLEGGPPLYNLHPAFQSQPLAWETCQAGHFTS